MRILPTGVLVAGLMMSASASAVVLDDRDIFEALLGTTILDDYDSPGYSFLQSDAAMSAVLGETEYVATGFPGTNIVSPLIIMGSEEKWHYYCAGCNGSFQLDFSSTSVSTGNGVFGVGFNFFNDGPLLYNAFVSYADGSTENVALDQVAFLDFAVPPGQTSRFFGIVSDELITTIAFGLENGGTTMEGSFGIDNLTIGSAPTSVPEPGSLALLSVGLVGLFCSRRRQITTIV